MTTGRPYDCDPEKEAANVRKHGLTFDDGYLTIRQMPERCLTYLDTQAHGEDRWITVASHPYYPIALHVTYLYREDRPRIIYVRRATPHERRRHANRYRKSH